MTPFGGPVVPDVYTYDDVEDRESSIGIGGGDCDNVVSLIIDDMVKISDASAITSNEIMLSIGIRTESSGSDSLAGMWQWLEPSHDILSYCS